jgi:hypothetical protein
LSEYKVTKVNLVQEDEAVLEDDGEDIDQEVAESEKDSQSPKKKAESPYWDQRPEPPVGEDGQVILFGETEKPKHQLPQRPAPPKAFGAKVKAEQQNLFSEKKPAPEQSGQHQKNESKTEEKLAEDTSGEVSDEEREKATLHRKEGANNDDKSFNVGETIEFEI